MGIWGKPNVEKLIVQKDIRGLQKASEDQDYGIRKAAILGLVKLNQIIPNSLSILALTNDPNIEVRKIAYGYAIVGEYGLFSHIAALHDASNLIRMNALDILNSYHQVRSMPIIKHYVDNGPDDEIQEKAKIYYQDFITKNQSNGKQDGKTQELKGDKWFLLETLMEEFALLMKKDENYNPVYPGNIFPYGSPLMHACRSYFIDAMNILPTDKDKCSQMLTFVQSCAIKGLNSVTSTSGSFTKLYELGPLPYNDYLMCVTIIFFKLNN